MKFRKAAALVLSVVILFCIGTMVVGCSVDDAQESNRNQITEMQNQIDTLQKRIDYLEKEMGEGEFFTLAQAYGKGWLTTEDLQTIAEYHNNMKSCDEKLESTLMSSIKESAAYYSRNDNTLSAQEINADDFIISHYYGNYNDCYAVIICYRYLHETTEYNPVYVEVGDVTFVYGNRNRIVIWKK